MANSASLRGGEKNVQDWINLICGILLFVSPWALRFSGDAMAARTAWVGGVIIFLMGLFALMQFAEWEEWIALVVGALVIISPWALDSRRCRQRCGRASCSASLLSCPRSRRSGSFIILQR